jgi:LytS/YehU family sensor histidine kinase
MFSSLYIVASFMPISPAIGITGAFFNLAWIVAPLCGILIGPSQGFLATLIGTTIYYSMGGFGLPFGFFSLLGPPLSTLQAGLLAHKHHKSSLLLLGRGSSPVSSSATPGT